MLVAALLMSGPWLPWRGLLRRARRVGAQVWPLVRHARTTPRGRPLEQIARDARRLSGWYRSCPRGQSFAKFEAHRRAYDDVLAEACAALGLVHLLSVIAPGPELDEERRRVEWALECAGLELGIPL